LDGSKRLFTDLFRDYNRQVLPRRQSNENVVVEMELHLSRLIDVVCSTLIIIAIIIIVIVVVVVVVVITYLHKNERCLDDTSKCTGESGNAKLLYLVAHKPTETIK